MTTERTDRLNCTSRILLAAAALLLMPTDGGARRYQGQDPAGNSVPSLAEISRELRSRRDPGTGSNGGVFTSEGLMVAPGVRGTVPARVRARAMARTEPEDAGTPAPPAVPIVAEAAGVPEDAGTPAPPAVPIVAEAAGVPEDAGTLAPTAVPVVAEAAGVPEDAGTLAPEARSLADAVESDTEADTTVEEVDAAGAVDGIGRETEAVPAPAVLPAESESVDEVEVAAIAVPVARDGLADEADLPELEDAGTPESPNAPDVAQAAGAVEAGAESAATPTPETEVTITEGSEIADEAVVARVGLAVESDSRVREASEFPPPPTGSEPIDEVEQVPVPELEDARTPAPPGAPVVVRAETFVVAEDLADELPVVVAGEVEAVGEIDPIVRESVAPASPVPPEGVTAVALPPAPDRFSDGADIVPEPEDARPPAPLGVPTVVEAAAVPEDGGTPAPPGVPAVVEPAGPPESRARLSVVSVPELAEVLPELADTLSVAPGEVPEVPVPDPIPETEEQLIVASAMRPMDPDARPRLPAETPEAEASEPGPEAEEEPLSTAGGDGADREAGAVRNAGEIPDPISSPETPEPLQVAALPDPPDPEPDVETTAPASPPGAAGASTSAAEPTPVVVEANPVETRALASVAAAGSPDPDLEVQPEPESVSAPARPEPELPPVVTPVTREEPDTALPPELVVDDTQTFDAVPQPLPLLVSAGVDQTIVVPENSRLPITVSLTGLVSAPRGAFLNVQWSQISGPAPVGFLSGESLETTVALLAAGEYELRLTVGSGLEERASDLRISVIVSQPEDVGTPGLPSAPAAPDAAEESGGR